MALNSKVIAFTKATSTGNQSITGAGFQGRAAIFFTAGAATSNTWISSPVSTLGYAAQNSSNGYSYGSISWSTQNGSDPTISSRRASDSVMAFLRYDGTLRDEADFVSFDSDGLTVNWTTASADNRLIYVLILGGSDLTDAEVVNFARSTSTGNQTVTGAGFTPDSMLLATTANSSTYNTNGGTSANFSFGACDGSSQFLTTVVDSNGQATAATAKGHRSNAIAGAIDTAGAYTTLGAWTSFNSDGCVINWSVNQGTAGRMCALFLKGCNATIRTAAKAASSSPSILSSGAMTYQPTAAIFASTWGGTLTGSGVSQLHYSFGISDCNGGDMGMAFNSVDAAATQVSQAVQVSTKSIIKVTENSATSTKAAEGTIASFNNGVDAYYSTTDSSTANMSYICFGPKGVKDVTNHIGNPNFETNTNGWSGSSGTLTRITSDSYTGSACGKLTITSTAAVPYIIHSSAATDPRRIPATSGDIVYASAWVKAGNAGAVGQEVKLQVRGFDSSNSTAIGSAQTGTGVFLSTSWQQVTITSTAMPASTFGIQFLIRAELSGLNTTDEILYDQIELRINQPLDVYVDGSQGTYHSWLGVTNDSRSIRSKIVKTSEFTADALLVNENTKEFTGDGIIFFTDNKEFTADALLVIVGTQEFTGDALVTGEFTSEFTSDGYIDFAYVENDIEFAGSAIVVEHISVFSDDFEDGLDTGWSYTAGVTEPFGLLAFDPTIGTTDPEIAYNTTSYFLDEAIIKVDNIGNMRSILGVEDAISGNIIAFDLDINNAAVINFSVYDAGTLSWNSYDSVSTGSNNWYKISYDGTDITWSTSPDGHTWTDHYNTTISEDFDFGNSRYYFSFDKSTNPTWPAYSNFRIESIGLVEYGFTADGYVVEVNNAEFTGDAVLVETNNKEFTASSIIQVTGTSDFTGSGLMFSTENKEFTGDAELSNAASATNTKDFTSDAHVVIVNTKEFTASANLSGAIGTKLYATSSNAIWSGDPLAYKGSWTQANFFRYLMSEDLDTIGVPVARALSETTTTNPNTAGMVMFTSPPLSTNQTVSGMLDFVLGMKESNAAANMSIQVHAYVTAGDTTTLRGTLVSNWNEPSTNEFTTTGMGYGVTGQIPCSTVNAQAGDFIIVEVGFYAANSSATSYNGTIYNGASTNPVELTVGNSNVTTRAGWIGFTQDLQFTYINRLEAFTADAIIGQTNTKEVTGSGIVKAETTKEFTGSGLVFIGDQTKEFTGSGVLQQTPINEFTASGLVQQSPTYEITADSIIFATNTSDFTGDSVLLGEQTLDINSNAIVLDTFDLEVSTDALVRDTITLDINSDSIVQDTIDLDVSASAIVLSTVELDVVSTGILQDTLVNEVTASAYVVIPVIINFTSDATIFATEFKEVTADAELVGAPGTVIATQVILSDIMGELMVVNDTFGSVPFVASDISTTVRVLKGGNE